MKIQVNETTKRYELLDGNKLVKSYVSRKDLQNYIDQNGLEITEEVSYESVSYNTPTFGINKRFEFVSQLSEMVITSNNITSFLLLGAPGIGKSHNLSVKLEEHNLTEDIDYVVFKGSVTARGLFDIIKNNPTKILIFDDCDDMLRNSASSAPLSNLIKAVADTKPIKTVSWVTSEGADQVTFTGKVIFISNLPKDKLDTAIVSRSFVVDLHMTLEETIERLDFILPHMDTDLPLEQRKECLDLLDEYKHISRDVNARTLLKIFAIRAGVNEELWKDLATYSIVN